MFFILFQIEIRKEYDDFSFIYFLFSVISFILSFLFGKFSNKFLSSLLRTLKPGDYIKIISEPDELIEKTVKINQLNKNETLFNKTTVFLSKKKLLCEDFLSQSSKMLNTINNKLCLYKSKSKDVYNNLKEKKVKQLYIHFFNICIITLLTKLK